MGIVSSIIRSRDDSVKPKKKSYWGFQVKIDLVDKEKVLSKKNLLPSDRKEIKHELSGIEPVEKLMVLSNSNKKMGRFTTSQVKELFDDMGFNVDVLVSAQHFSDIDAVINIGGFTIPGWVYLARLITKNFPSKEKLILSKLSPGKDRLHVRIFESNDGTWVIFAHTDANWLSLNLKKIYKSHLRGGSGDYTTGIIMLVELITKFSESIEKNKIFQQTDIDKAIKSAYRKSLLEKMKNKFKKSN